MAAEGEDNELNRPGPSRRAGKLFLGGVGYETSEAALQKHFSQYGDLLEVAILRDRITGKPRGFGFVTFKDPADAERAVADHHVVDGREIDVKKSVPQESKGRARKIFVGGLSPDTTEEEFKEYFSRFGAIAEVQIMVDHMSGRSRGFGFITFEEDGAAERVFQVGVMHDIRGKRVEVKPATPKGSGPQVAGVPHPSNASAAMMQHFAVGDRRSSADFGMPPAMLPGYVSPAAVGPTASFPYGMYGYTPPARPGAMPYPPAYGIQYQTIPPAMPPQYIMPGYGVGGHPYGRSGPSYGQHFGAEHRLPPFTGLGQFSRRDSHRQSESEGRHAVVTNLRTGSTRRESSVQTKGRDEEKGVEDNESEHNEKPIISRTKVDSASSLDQAATEQRMRNLSLE